RAVEVPPALVSSIGIISLGCRRRTRRTRKCVVGGVKGTQDFRKAVLSELKDETARRGTESEAAEIREPRWERAVVDLLRLLGRGEEELANSPKGAPWVVKTGQPNASCFFLRRS